MNAVAAESESNSVKEKSEPYRFQRSLSLLEQILKIAGLLAGFGYIALRSHLARLGITSATSFGIERYLSEFYTMLWDVLFRGMIAFILIVPVLLLGVCGMAVLKRTQKFSAIFERGRIILRTASLNPWIPATLLLLFVWMTLWMLRQVSAIQDSAAVVGRLKDVSGASTAGAHVFEVLFWGVLAGGLMCWGILKSSNQEPGKFLEVIAQFLWKVCNVFLFVLALHVPLLYGAYDHDTKYPAVSVVSEKGGTVCGLLILQTSNDYRIWLTDGTAGRIVIVPGGQIRTIVAGSSVDIVELASKAARGDRIQYCPE